MECDSNYEPPTSDEGSYDDSDAEVLALENLLKENNVKIFPSKSKKNAIDQAPIECKSTAIDALPCSVIVYGILQDLPLISPTDYQSSFFESAACLESNIEIEVPFVAPLADDQVDDLPRTPTAFSQTFHRNNDEYDDDEDVLPEFSQAELVTQPDGPGPSTVKNISDSNFQNQDETTTQSPHDKRQRKRVSEPQEWKRAQAKTRRMQGEEYLGFRPVGKKKIVQDIIREKRKLGPPCQSAMCKKWKDRLCDTIQEEGRQRIFDNFWRNMTWDSKKMFVCATVVVTDVKRKTEKKPGSNKYRTRSYSYFLKVNGERVPVCKKMYLSTLGLRENEVRYWLQSFQAKDRPDKKRRGIGYETCEQNEEEDSESNKVQNNVNPKPLMERRQFLDTFFCSLPTLPSHCCRKSSNKLYLQTDVNSWTQLYKIYVKKCNENEEVPMSRYNFDQVRRKKNVDIFVPKKDRCDLCSSYEFGHVTAEVYEAHQKKKCQAREEKERDKEAAARGECHSLVLDLMKVQTCPWLRASSAYFKLKLVVHNYTVYNLDTHDAKLYWFDETEANLCASTFASCLIDYVNELLDQSFRDLVVIFSDGCTHQNRNSTLANALLHLCVQRKVTVVQKYLEKGHTQMECDSVHSLVERRWKNCEVYTPSNFVGLSQSARDHPMPYRAVLLDRSFFRDFSKNEFYTSIRPGKTFGDPTVTDLRAIKYTPEGKIFFKLRFDEEFKEMPRRSRRMNEDFPHNFPPLFPTRPRIPKDKWMDLQSLKPLMPSDTHPYYDSIPHEDESKRQMKRNTSKSKKP